MLPNRDEFTRGRQLIVYRVRQGGPREDTIGGRQLWGAFRTQVRHCNRSENLPTTAIAQTRDVNEKAARGRLLYSSRGDRRVCGLRPRSTNFGPDYCNEDRDVAELGASGDTQAAYRRDDASTMPAATRTYSLARISWLAFATGGQNNAGSAPMICDRNRAVGNAQVQLC
jgi:hypothetical protein